MAMKISIGPIPYYWDMTRVRKFYEELADLPVDIVYLGETVCSKRRAVHLEDWLQIAEQLQAAGKDVALSTLALTEAESELAGLRRITENGRLPVEANDMAAVHLLAGTTPFIIGPHINIYNDCALTFLYEQGATRWVVPVELGQYNLARILDKRPPGLEIEIIAYGRLPLAFSARCFCARAHDRGKDDCEFICNDYPDGLLLKTQDQDPFLIINGIQIQSARTQNLIRHLDGLIDLGVDLIRIVPQMEHIRDIILAFHDVLEGKLPPEDGLEQLAQTQLYGCCDGYWQQQAGMKWI
jgi:O2-independent ubiquinone biosynthesis protein UbiV